MITTIAHISNHLHLHLNDFALLTFIGLVLGLILGVVFGLSILTFIGRSRKS